MDFFDRQAGARRRTRWLVAWLGVAVLAIIVAVYAALQAILTGARVTGSDMLEAAPAAGFWDGPRFALVAIAVGSLVAIASAYKVLALSRGGEQVAIGLGGRPLDPNTRDARERRLLNVVEEMAIASGLPAPTVFLLADEPGINAFAAGLTPSDAVIGVTRGAIEHLSRDELQGVIAHEVGHILAGDMRLNLRLIGVLHGILVLALTGQWLLRSLRWSGGRRSTGGVVAGMAILGVTLLAAGWIGVLCGRLIKSGVSRQRELLADASAVQFTRNPLGLASALKKIGGLADGSRLRTAGAEEASHLFFGNGLRESRLRWFSTHPPLARRIAALDPSWDGVFPAVEEAQRSALDPARSAVATGLGAAIPALHGGEGGAVRIEPTAVAARIGTIEPTGIAHARQTVDRIPQGLREAVREPANAAAVLYALLLDQEPAVRERQLARLEMEAGPDGPRLLAEVGRMLQLVKPVAEDLRLPLVDLSLPALRRQSSRQYRLFLRIVRALAGVDGGPRLFEFVVQRILARHLAPAFDGPEPSRVTYASLRGLRREVMTVLSALVDMGSTAERPEAYAAGLERLTPELGAPARPALPLPGCGLTEVDMALRGLAQASPASKRLLVEAVAAAIVYDRRVTIVEAELLRAICDALNCPMPPFRPEGASSEGSLATLRV